MSEQSERQSKRVKVIEITGFIAIASIIFSSGILYARVDQTNKDLQEVNEELKEYRSDIRAIREAIIHIEVELKTQNKG